MLDAELTLGLPPLVTATTGIDAMEHAIEGLFVATQQIAQMAGIETTLQQVGISETDLSQLTDDAMKQTRLLGNNPREMTRDNARAIYATAL